MIETVESGTNRMHGLAADLIAVRQSLKKLQDEAIAPLMKRQAEIQDALCQQMAEAGIKTLDAAGLQFQRRITRLVEISDEAEFIAALSEAGMLEDCLRLDRTAAKKAAKGLEMPGTVLVARESFAVVAKGGAE